MTAYTRRDDYATLRPAGRAPHAQHYAAARHSRRTVIDRIADYFQRQATLRELALLTDRELDDIGLQRAQMHMVFDPSFMASRFR